ncbi:hypothetical protein DOY81_014822, partial [Sarcophaga bullata]
NFTLIATYAPNIVYNNILICGQAIELNCSTDFMASITTDQLYMFSCHCRRLQRISETINQVCKPKQLVPNSNMESQSDSALYMTPESSSSSAGGVRSFQSLSSSNSLIKPDTRRFKRLGSQTQFESIDEDFEPPPAKTDSGVLSQSTKTKDNHCTARSISSTKDRLICM